MDPIETLVLSLEAWFFRFIFQALALGVIYWLLPRTVFASINALPAQERATGHMIIFGILAGIGGCLSHFLMMLLISNAYDSALPAPELWVFGRILLMDIAAWGIIGYLCADWLERSKYDLPLGDSIAFALLATAIGAGLGYVASIILAQLGLAGHHLLQNPLSVAFVSWLVLEVLWNAISTSLHRKGLRRTLIAG